MQNRIGRLIAVFLLLVSFCANAQRQLPPFKKFIHTAGNDSLPYGLLEPITTKPNQKYPLVLFLHGAGERGKDNESQLKHIKILYNYNVLDKYPSFVLAPQCPKQQFWTDLVHGRPFSETPNKTMAMVIEILDKVMKEYPVDPARVYITGVSMGGYGTWDLITRFPDRFAAAVPICGGGDERVVDRIKRIPIWAFHGAEDDVVPPRQSRKMVAALQAVGATPGYTEYPGVKHGSWSPAYKDPNLMPWLMKQRLPAPETR
jgi:Predicted peptidase